MHSNLVRDYLKLDSDTIEERVVKIKPDCDKHLAVALLIAYMEKRGLKFYNDGDKAESNSPYGILTGKTSVGFKKPDLPEINEPKVVLYCARDNVDRDRIKLQMNKKFHENSETTRPFFMMFDPDEIPQVVTLLLENPKNV